MTYVQELIRKRMKSFRFRHRLTQEEAAGLAEIAYKVWQKHESGRCKIMLVETAEKIADGMSVSLAELVGEADPDTAAHGVRSSSVHQASPRYSYGLPTRVRRRKTDWQPVIYSSHR